ncbi:unnamed protein product [Diabrotica balteata]|uniref:Peptidase S1 domain-containing protein n=1 Tax=Diabrotica balteata TaxID=107213 RepID=A0A9P0GV61_DIABA|nr:unnamed protein product [Diabrotica balteata]
MCQYSKSKITCRPGQVLSESGVCIYPQTPATTLRPTCPPGQIPSLSGSACDFPKTPRPTYPTVATQRPYCPFGTRLSPSTNKCEPIQQTTGYVYPTPSITFPTSTPSPKCKPGQSLSPTGICVYPSKPTSTPTCRPGQIKTSTGVCEYPSKKTPCSPGQFLSDNGDCVYPSSPTPKPQITCLPGQILTPLGVCQYSKSKITCRPGQVLSESGVCIYPQTPATTLRPTCPPGQIPSLSGSACDFPKTPRPTYPTVPTQRPYCPFGTRLSPSTNKCEPIQQTTGYIYPTPSITFPTSTPSPKCKPGQSLSPTGICVYPNKPTSTPTCRPGQIKTSTGVCEYPSKKTPCSPGQFLSDNGDCVYSSSSTSKPQITCRPGQILTPSGVCQYSMSKITCRPGQVLSESGICIYPQPPTTTSRTTCPPGQILSLSGSACEIPKTSRPTIPTISTLRPYCPFGTRLFPSTKKCEPIQQTTGYVYPTPSVTFPTPTQCPAGQIKNVLGKCELVSLICPPGYIKTSFGKCESIKATVDCPLGYEKSAEGNCVRSKSTPCPSGKFRTPFGECRDIKCPNGSSRSPNGQCTYPNPTGQPTDTNTHNIPSYPTEQPYRPPTTDDGYHYDRPDPPFELPSTDSSENIPGPTTEHEGMDSKIKESIRLPDHKEENAESANNNDVFISTKKPTRGPTKGPTRGPTKGPTRRPPPDTGDEIQAPAGCAAALKCVQEIYCTAEGVVSPVPVVLSKEQEILRVPTTACRDIETGILGKCCRDPNYKDPWPSANLVDGIDDGQYKEDNFYGQHQLLNTNRLARNATRGVKGIRRQTVKRVEDEIRAAQPTCGGRNLNTNPVGPGPLDANFAEYPWQAMILRDTNRSLLCGGAIIARDAVLTAAHCIEGLQTSDVLVKGGEWKLGIDEEPLPFQIIKVAAIVRHPSYKQDGYDLAILKLTEKFRLSKNVGTICLPDAKAARESYGNCKVTGWGKRILQLHARGAIMHHIDAQLIDKKQCTDTVNEKFQDSASTLKDHTLCVTSDIDQCKVDYGSALACTNDQGKYVLSGIYAWDTGCRQEGQIGGYIPTDVKWVEESLRKPLKELRRLDREYLLNSNK